MSINYELNVLLNKVKTIYIITGGEKYKEDEFHKLSKYDQKKVKLNLRIRNIEDLQNTLVESKDNLSIESIRLKNSLRYELMDLKKDICEFSDDKIYHEIKDDEEIKQTIEYAIKLLSVSPSKKDIIDSNCFTISIDDVISGKYNGNELSRESITCSQQIVINEIDEEKKIQDNILDQMECNLQTLYNTTTQIHDEIKFQNEILTDTIQKTDTTNLQLENTNDNMSRIQKKINSKSGKLCSYIICTVILLILFVILYNLIK
jgi:hypothetical protein